MAEHLASSGERLLGDRHLSVVHTDSSEIEYDEDFVSSAGADIRIVFQGKDVVKNRKLLLGKLAHQSIEQ